MNFEQIVTKGEIANDEQFYPFFSLMFSAQSNKYNFIYWDFSTFCKDVLKVVCCSFDVPMWGRVHADTDINYTNKTLMKMHESIASSKGCKYTLWHYVHVVTYVQPYCMLPTVCHNHIHFFKGQDHFNHFSDIFLVPDV